MFSAESAVFFHLKAVGAVFLVFHCVVVTLFALRASQCYFYTHYGTPPENYPFYRLRERAEAAKFPHTKKRLLNRSISIITHSYQKVNNFLQIFLSFYRYGSVLRGGRKIRLLKPQVYVLCVKRIAAVGTELRRSLHILRGPAAF